MYFMCFMECIWRNWTVSSEGMVRGRNADNENNRAQGQGAQNIGANSEDIIGHLTRLIEQQSQQIQQLIQQRDQ